MPGLEPNELERIAVETARGVSAAALLEPIVFRGEVTLVIERKAIVPVIEALRSHPQLAFNHLSDVTAIDYLETGRMPRFDVVYHLYSIMHGHRIRLRAPVEETESACWVDSITHLWRGADFMEREVYDMFGIRFHGHPDLRRILMPDNWQGHPLRKDHPLGGSTSFYYKQDTNEYAGEPDDLVPRIRVQQGDV